jgi:CheY-like chemotaxis protein
MGKSHHRKFVLVVEGNKTLGTALVRTMIAETQDRAFLVTSVIQAIKVVGSFQPDLIVLGTHLLERDTEALYEKLHALPQLRTVPIAFV